METCGRVLSLLEYQMDECASNCHLHRMGPLSIQLSVRVCGQSLKLGELLSWEPGTVLSFNQDASAPLQLRIRDKLIGEGVAVKVGSKFGLRLKQIGR